MDEEEDIEMRNTKVEEQAVLMSISAGTTSTKSKSKSKSKSQPTRAPPTTP